MIEVQDLVKNFNGFCAVNHISFNVLDGNIFALLGPNGAGKTTIIKMLTTILKPTSGNIKIGSFDPVYQPLEVRKIFGIVFQDPSLDEELTAYENLELHCILYGLDRKKRTEKIKTLLDLVELSDRQNDFVKYYSGGMKRRLEIARAFLHDPKLLFLDEPTLGLDPQTRKHIWDYIKKSNANQKTTVLFTTHYMEEAEKVADHIAIIDCGKIIEQGTVNQLKEKTNTHSLEEAFIDLTGHMIREETVSSLDSMRLRRRLWKK